MFTVSGKVLEGIAVQRTNLLDLEPEAAALGLIFLLIGGASEAPGQADGDRVGEPILISPNEVGRIDCGLRKEEVDVFVDRRPTFRGKRGRSDTDIASRSTIKVDYSGLPGEARDAFDRTTAIWERHIRSETTIRIEVSYQYMGPHALGGSVPGSVYPFDTDSDEESDALIVSAPADALTADLQHPGPLVELARL